jgi:release factor glutamine methyltransferase
VQPLRWICEAAAARLRKAGVESPVLEAQLLVGMAMELSRVQVLLGDDVEPTAHQARQLERLLAERERRVPLAYLRGTQEFYGLTFEVSPAVLIPRPETELLVELAVERLTGSQGGSFVDLGTGSGCIAVSILHSLPESLCIAIDVSPNALDVARRNSVRHGVTDRLQFVRADGLQPLRSRNVNLILSNPPYIPSEEIEQLQPEVRIHEPRLALDGGVSGLAFHRRLVTDARRVLKRDGLVAVEVAAGQANQVGDIMREHGFKNVTTHYDLAGIGRVVTGETPEG